jgi:hypothetical protein
MANRDNYDRRLRHSAGERLGAEDQDVVAARHEVWKGSRGAIGEKTRSVCCASKTGNPGVRSNISALNRRDGSVPTLWSLWIFLMQSD